MPKTALVTGSRGFAGTHLRDRLSARGWEVVGTDLEESDRERFYTETDNATHPVYGASPAEERSGTFVPADLTRPETLEPLFEDRDYDAVFHLGSLFDYFAERAALHAVNVDGARNLATLAADAGVDHFVGISTLGVLAEAGFDEPNTEDAPYAPHNRYCESKRAQEEALRKIEHDRGLPLTILRPAPHLRARQSLRGLSHPARLEQDGICPGVPDLSALQAAPVSERSRRGSVSNGVVRQRAP